MKNEIKLTREELHEARAWAQDESWVKRRKYEDDPEIYDSAVMGYATAAFTVLSGVITNRKCLDRYDELRDGLLGFKKQILFEKRYPFKYKFKLMLLWCSPKLYNKTIRKVRGA